MDTVGVATRNVKRRGSGWLDGDSQLGYSNRLGWYHGFHLLLATTPQGVISGYGFGGGNEKDQPLAETFLALRSFDASRLPTVGQSLADGHYVVDKGFTGKDRRKHWREDFGAVVVGIPQSFAAMGR